MKKELNAYRILSRKWSVLALAVVALTGFSSVSATTAKDATASNDAVDAKRLVVTVNDLKGRASFNSEYARENLLRGAFADAARKADWLGEYEFGYNGIASDEKAGRLEFNVIDWRRSAAGMYNFTASVSYWNLDGEKTNLGTVRGLRTSIDVFNRWDIGDKFSETAEEAFRDALRKLKDVEATS